MIKKRFQQGEIWMVRLDPSEGSEIRKTRPCLIISRTKINEKLNTLTIIPFSSGITNKSILLINIEKSQTNGLKTDSHLVIPQVRTVAKHRLKKKLGQLDTKYIPKIKRSFSLYFWE